MSTCECGHVRLMHTELSTAMDSCRACRCRTFVTAADATAATEAAHARQAEHQQLHDTARRALARREYDHALGAVLALIDLDRRTP